MRKHPETQKEPTTKNCPYCQTTIAINATRCPNCTSHLDGQPQNQPQQA
jgi:large conductance mechanosensitive channel